MLKKIEYKSKEILDRMSKKDIDDYRSSILQQQDYTSDDMRYINELKLYSNIRFKDDVLARYQRWANSDEESAQFLSGIINRTGHEKFYQLSIEQDMMNLGGMIYIK